MINKNFQDSLRYYRKSRMLTQDQLGDILGVSGQTIYKYENGVTFPPPETLEKILTYFQIAPNTLFKYESSSSNYLNELEKLLENHKRIHKELAVLKEQDIPSPIEDFINEVYPPTGQKPSRKSILELQRHILIQKIEKLIIKLESEI